MRFFPEEFRKELIDQTLAHEKDLDREIVTIGRVSAWKSRKGSEDEPSLESKGPLFYSNESTPSLLKSLQGAMLKAQGKGFDGAEPSPDQTDYVLVGCFDRLKTADVPLHFEFKKVADGSAETKRTALANKALSTSLEDCKWSFDPRVRQFELDLLVTSNSFEEKPLAVREVHLRPRGLWIGAQLARVFDQPEYRRTAVFVQRKPLPANVDAWIQSSPTSRSFALLREISSQDKIPKTQLQVVLENRSLLNRMLNFFNQKKIEEGLSLSELSNQFKFERNIEKGTQAANVTITATAPIGGWQSGQLVGNFLGGILSDSATVTSAAAHLSGFLLASYRTVDVAGLNQSFFDWLDQRGEAGNSNVFARGLRALDASLLALVFATDVQQISSQLDNFTKMAQHLKAMELSSLGQLSAVSRSSGNVLTSLAPTVKASIGALRRLALNKDVYEQALKNLLRFRASNNNSATKNFSDDEKKQQEAQLTRTKKFHLSLFSVLQSYSEKSDGKLTPLEITKRDLRNCLTARDSETRLQCFDAYLVTVDQIFGRLQKLSMNAYDNSDESLQIQVEEQDIRSAIESVP